MKAVLSSKTFQFAANPTVINQLMLRLPHSNK